MTNRIYQNRELLATTAAPPFFSVDLRLAASVGLNESIFLTEIDSLKSEGGAVKSSLKAIAERLPFMSYATVKRTQNKLRAIGVLAIEKPRACALDQSNAYRVNKDQLSLLCSIPTVITPRKAVIPKTMRAMVFARDSHKCLHCGSESNLSCDHIRPESKGGETTLENLQTLCKSCNSKKGVKV